MSRPPTNQSLLKQPLSGYPDAYICARLAPRLRALRHLLDEDIAARRKQHWSALRRTVLWSYSQLSPSLRKQLEPVYLLLEFPHLATGIRLSAAGQHEQSARCLRQSLWNDSLLKAITGRVDENELIHELQRHIHPHGWILADDSPTTDLHWIHRLERNLFSGLTNMLVARRFHGSVCEWLEVIIDLANLARLRRNAGVSPDPFTLSGGRLDNIEWHNPAKLGRGIACQYGIHSPDMNNPEPALRFWLRDRLFRQARLGGALPRVLALLWGHYTLADEYFPSVGEMERAA